MGSRGERVTRRVSPHTQKSVRSRAHKRSDQDKSERVAERVGGRVGRWKSGEGGRFVSNKRMHNKRALGGREAGYPFFCWSLLGVCRGWKSIGQKEAQVRSCVHCSGLKNWCSKWWVVGALFPIKRVLCVLAPAPFSQCCGSMC